MKIETLDVQGFDSAIYGMRNPLKSHSKMDSYWAETENFDAVGPDAFHYIIGKNDYDLMKRLWKAGNEHRKYLRMIQVWVNILAPRYFWTEWETYKIATTANSESTMHRLTKDGVTKEDLEFIWGVDPTADRAMELLLQSINNLIKIYNSINDKNYKEKLFQDIKGLLPESFMQMRTINLNYETLATMYRQRKNHRLPQWRETFVSWVETLPYNELITGAFDE